MNQQKVTLQWLQEQYPQMRNVQIIEHYLGTVVIFKIDDQWFIHLIDSREIAPVHFTTNPMELHWTLESVEDRDDDHMHSILWEIWTSLVANETNSELTSILLKEENNIELYLSESFRK